MDERYVMLYGKEHEIKFKGVTLHQIQATKKFGNIEAGALGGYIEKYENLSQEGTCWVSKNACVFGEARVSDSARVTDNARVYGHASVHDDAELWGDALVSENAVVCGHASVFGNALVGGDAYICEHAHVADWAVVCGRAYVCGHTRLEDNVRIRDDALIQSDGDYSYHVVTNESCRTNLTFFNCKDKRIKVDCDSFSFIGTIAEDHDSFFGTIAKFRETEEKNLGRHGSARMARKYLAIADMAELHLSEGHNYTQLHAVREKVTKNFLEGLSWKDEGPKNKLVDVLEEDLVSKRNEYKQKLEELRALNLYLSKLGTEIDCISADICLIFTS